MLEQCSWSESWITGYEYILGVPQKSRMADFQYFVIQICRDDTGTVKKSRKVSGDRGSGGRASSGVQGQRPGGARAFSQSELPRKPPIDTHGRYTYNTCTGGREKKKSEGRKQSEKQHTWICHMFWFHQIKHLLLKRMIPRSLNWLGSFNSKDSNFLKYSIHIFNFFSSFVRAIGQKIHSVWPSIHSSYV